eukprot:TRINITY_DN3098_c0_g2_i4.p3 TRINITY_DN3098_c0_g2~~TRINITY_DN3098_c0_g2_i4.p3  ORF type:complete len:131 (+),score=8.42 TRINITY_DN3098_c0_g2_i4:352-744(+)
MKVIGVSFTLNRSGFHLLGLQLHKLNTAANTSTNKLETQPQTMTIQNSSQLNTVKCGGAKQDLTIQQPIVRIKPSQKKYGSNKNKYFGYSTFKSCFGSDCHPGKDKGTSQSTPKKHPQQNNKATVSYSSK